MTSQTIVGRHTSGIVRAVLLVCAIAFPNPARAQESATVTLPTVVTFNLDTASTTNGAPEPTPVQFSDALLIIGRVLRISVIADSSNFTGSGGDPLPSSAVSWTVSGAQGGTGSNGNLSGTGYTQVFQSFLLRSSGGCNVTWKIAALPPGVRAGTHTLSIRWKVEAVFP